MIGSLTWNNNGEKVSDKGISYNVGHGRNQRVNHDVHGCVVTETAPNTYLINIFDGEAQLM